MIYATEFSVAKLDAPETVLILLLPKSPSVLPDVGILHSIDVFKSLVLQEDSKFVWFHKWKKHTVSAGKYGRKAGVGVVPWIWESLSKRKPRAKYDLDI